MAAPAVPGPTLGQVITVALDHADTLPPLSAEHWRVLHALRVCRTVSTP